MLLYHRLLSYIVPFTDVGYAGSVNEILNRYFQKFYPLAIEIGTQLEQGGYVEKLAYTTHPWLVTMYLDCPPNLVLAGVKLQVILV